MFRVVTRVHLESAGVPAHLIPVRIEGFGAVWDFETPALCLKVGQKLYFDKPIVVEACMDFILITSRSDGSTNSMTAA